MAIVSCDASAFDRESVRRFHEDGYVIVRGLFDDDQIREALDEAERLSNRRDLIFTENIRCRWQDHVETKECLFECFDPVVDIGPVCGRLANDSKLVGIVSALYGEQACLLKDKLIFKPPGAKGYDLHQDYIAWPGFPRSFVTAVVALDPTREENGCTVVYPGYHRQGSLSPEDGEYHPLSPTMFDPAHATPLVLDPGDVAIFGGFTPHGSGPNRSHQSRRQLYLSYNKISDGGTQRDRHYADFHVWLRKKYAEYGKVFVYFQ